MAGLTSSESTVARWVLANSTVIPSLSMGQVAAECGVSDTTVLRLCRRAGFRGFTDLKFRLIEDGARALAPEPGLLDEGYDAGLGVAASVFEDCIQGLRDTLNVLGDSFDAALDLLEAASEVLVIGVGTSRPVVEAAQSQLARLGVRCRSQTDSYLQLMEVALLRPPALVIGVSYSGASLDPIETLRRASERGLRTMCITGMPGSPITAHAEVSLAAVATEMRTEPVAGRVVQTALVSALARAFADRHPASTSQAETAAFDSVIDKTL